MTNAPNPTDSLPALTPEDHVFFLEHGYLIVRNVVPPETIAAAVAFLEEGDFEGQVGAANYRPRHGEAVEACLKPFSEMSSAEKVYSARYLREVKGLPIPEPPLTLDARTDAALREGVLMVREEGANTIFAEIRSYIPFIEQGRPGILFTGSPSGIQRAMSRDFVTWKYETVFAPPDVILNGPLHDYKRDDGVTLLVAGPPSHAETRIFAGPDARNLQLVGTIPGAAFGFAHFTTDYGSEIARGRVLFTHPADRPNEIRCGWGETWADALAHAQETLAAELPADYAVRDAFAQPSNAGPPFALILDVLEPFDKKSGAPETRPYFSVSRDVARYETPTPLVYDTETAPRQIRVYARARNYWLVTFLRPVNGKARLFWGVIDWEKSPVTLTQIQTASALRDALCVVGWV